jgi:spore coat polysaccharide biosynthesis protein SpsF (cytidylyltransferase family)
MLKTLGVVQARMGSSRLPGKSLRPLAGRTVLGLLLERIQRCRELDAIAVATSDRSIDDSIADLVERHALMCVRGSEGDVLGRFHRALCEAPAETVVRICADNPLTDPEQVDALVRFFYGRECDYAYNNRPECGLPGGIGAEVVSASALRLVHEQATAAVDREHVTLYMLNHRDMFKVETLMAPATLRYPSIRLDVDHEHDLLFLESVCDLLRQRPGSCWETNEIIDVIRAKPELLAFKPTQRPELDHNAGRDDLSRLRPSRSRYHWRTM